jgi:hypothetical protein
MLCHVCRQIFLDHADAPAGEEFRHHSSFQDLEQAAKQHCEVCERLFNHAAEISYPILQPELTDSTKAYTVYMIARNCHPHVCFLFRFGGYYYSEDLFNLSELDRAMYSMAQVTVSFILTLEEEAIWPGMDWKLPDPTLELTSLILTKMDTTRSISSFTRISHWLKYCAKNHHTCSELDTRCWAPTRLIAVGTESSPILKLYITQGNCLAKGQRYISLSHRWGSADVKKPLKGNFTTFQCDIPEQELPQTYKDAFQIARRLGAPFIWIDSLCIVQDCENDWRQESKAMGKVYRHAWLNVSADSATDSNTGCFSTRPLSHLAPFRIPTRPYTPQPNVQPTNVFFENEISQDNVGNAPLNNRGWVLQERVLAPRIVHYCAREIFWECHELQACERFPTGLPTIQGASNLLNGNIFCYHQTTPDRVTRALKKWKEIVSVYSSCALTKEEDKLMAISDIATEMQKMLGNDKYLAGLWRSQLPDGLCWTVLSVGRSTRPKTYRAPSWSWTSLDGEVATSPHPRNSYIKKKLFPAPNILDIETTLVDENSCGQISNGFLKIQGKTMLLEWGPEDHERYLGDVVLKAIMEIANHFHGVSHGVEVFLDSFDDPWIEGAYMVPVLTYCDVENRDSPIMQGLLLAGTDTTNLRRFGVCDFKGSRKNLLLILDSLSEEILTIY